MSEWSQTSAARSRQDERRLVERVLRHWTKVAAGQRFHASTRPSTMPIPTVCLAQNRRCDHRQTRRATCMICMRLSSSDAKIRSAIAPVTSIRDPCAVGTGSGFGSPADKPVFRPRIPKRQTRNPRRRRSPHSPQRAAAHHRCGNDCRWARH